jgi:SAM-dependent methyltransferase
MSANPAPARPLPGPPESEWDGVAAGWAEEAGAPLWRRHSDLVNARLLTRRLGPPVGHLLKTDLFDEFTAQGLYPLLSRHARRVTGIDVSPLVVKGAKARHPGLDAVTADVRRLPFPDAAFDAVVSNSTLDHFEGPADVAAALAQIRRVMAPGGRLLITLDNPLNPLLALRNRLPAAAGRRLRGVDYPVGWTCGPRRLRALLREAGFAVEGQGAVMHGPRVLLSPPGRGAGSRAGERALAAMAAAERLERLPTRYLTGHFVAAWATAEEE